MNHLEHATLVEIATGTPFEVRPRLLKFLETVKVEEKGTRTGKQNNSFHLWLEQVAQELDKNGFTIQNVTAKIQRAEIRPTGDNLKEVMFRPYMIAATGKKSTTQLKKNEVDKIYEGLNKFIGENFHIHVPFPSDENRAMEELSGVRLGAHNNISKDDNYPEYTGAPTI